MAAKLWLIVGGGGKIMAGRGWSHDSVMPLTKTSYKKKKKKKKKNIIKKK